MKGRRIRIATCQFAVSANIRRNSRQVERQMRQAKRGRADIVHFPEAALSGYGGVDCLSWDSYDWELLREETRRIMRLARELGQWVVLGSAHYLGERYLPHNCLYLVNPAGRIAGRYDKRFCTSSDLEYYSPGGRDVIFTIKGIRCSLLICFDVRFPELYREHRRRGVEVILQSFYNARAKERGIWTEIIRQTMQARAAANSFWLSGTNSCAYYGLWPSVFIQPDGRIAGQLRFHRAGVMVNTVDTGKEFYDPSGPFRARAMRGKLHSGKLVSCARSRNRRSL